ncbi:MAG: hypothetical protein ACE5KM_14335, partial [Planctomycetaceae bacterium]
MFQDTVGIAFPQRVEQCCGHLWSSRGWLPNERSAHPAERPCNCATNPGSIVHDHIKHRFRNAAMISRHAGGVGGCQTNTGVLVEECSLNIDECLIGHLDLRQRP